MHRHELSVLNALKEPKRLSLAELLDATGLGKDEALWAVTNLESQKYVSVKRERKSELKYTQEGEEYRENGLPEIAFVKKVAAGKTQLDTLGEEKNQIGLLNAKKKGYVLIKNGKVELTAEGEKVVKRQTDADNAAIMSGKLHDIKADTLANFVKRGLVEEKIREEVKGVEITHEGVLQLAQANQNEEQMIGALDRNTIQNRLWSGKKFKPYNVNAPVEAADAATRHPLQKLIDEAREAYISMGFTEVNGPVIQPSFWTFDYLFIPQDHPAREAQDTFFLSRPNELEIKDKKLIKRIKEAHEGAWHGEWSEKLAMQAVPRTHMTSITGMYINEIINKINSGEKYELPCKLFSIGRVFRNENLDFKHLADFYQMDGIVIGKGLTLANLFDTLIKLYDILGIKLKFKPAYFPFVEPGVEAYAELDNGWIELFGAGIIRKEVTGVERNSINVLAWGPGMERTLLIRKKISNIPELYGASMGWLRERSLG